MSEGFERPSKWIPETRLLAMAHVGKLGEEAAELAEVCLGLPDFDALAKEMADVRAMSELAIRYFKFDRALLSGCVVNAMIGQSWDNEFDVFKLGVAASRVSNICHRISIQGIYGLDPETQTPNLVTLLDRIAIVLAMCNIMLSGCLSQSARQQSDFDLAYIDARTQRKIAMKQDWHAMIVKEDEFMNRCREQMERLFMSEVPGDVE